MFGGQRTTLWIWFTPIHLQVVPGIELRSLSLSNKCFCLLGYLNNPFHFFPFRIDVNQTGLESTEICLPSAGIKNMSTARQDKESFKSIRFSTILMGTSERYFGSKWGKPLYMLSDDPLASGLVEASGLLS